MFKDKTYDEMDDISRMFEPFQFDLNDELSKFPDRLEVDPEILFKNRSWHGGYGSSVRNALLNEAEKLGLDEIVNKHDILLNKEFFKFEIEKEETEDEEVKVILNASTMQLSHKIFLVKDKIAFDEQELEQMRKDVILSTIRRNLNHSRNLNKPRFNEIADIYNATKVKSERSYRGKIAAFCEHLETLLDEKVLDLRDMTLCHNFARWIVMYVRGGNLAALNNLTRVKIITHEKRPIYSIEEKEV